MKKSNYYLPSILSILLVIGVLIGMSEILFHSTEKHEISSNDYQLVTLNKPKTHAKTASVLIADESFRHGGEFCPNSSNGLPIWNNITYTDTTVFSFQLLDNISFSPLVDKIYIR